MFSDQNPVHTSLSPQTCHIHLTPFIIGNSMYSLPTQDNDPYMTAPPFKTFSFQKNIYYCMCLTLCTVTRRKPLCFGRSVRTKYSKKKKGKGHPCTGTEALYRPYGPWEE